MDDELRKAISDYFEVGEFAEYIGVSVDDLIEMFPDEFDDAFDDILELMEYERPGDEND